MIIGIQIDHQPLNLIASSSRSFNLIWSRSHRGTDGSDKLKGEGGGKEGELLFQPGDLRIQSLFSLSIWFSVCFPAVFVCIFIFVCSNHSKKDAAETGDEDANDEKRFCSNSVDIWSCYRGHLKAPLGRQKGRIAKKENANIQCSLCGSPILRVSQQWFYQHCDKEASAHHNSRLQGTEENWFWLVAKKEAYFWKLISPEQWQEQIGTTMAKRKEHLSPRWLARAG